MRGGLDRFCARALGEAQFVARMGRERVLGHELTRDLPCEVRLQASLFVDMGEFDLLLVRLLVERALFAREVRASESACELTETYSPAAIAIAPAAQPATAAVRMSPRVAAAAATPTMRLAVEMIPSLAPSTAALNQPARLT